MYSQGDDAVVGRLTDTYSLGIYQQAYKISTLPLTEITKLFNQFTFPVYSNISDDIKRLKKAFYKTSFVILLMVTPIGVGLLIFADLLVEIVLGDQWMQVVPLVRALSLFGITRAFIVSTYPLFNSLKKQKYVTVLSFIQVILMSITIFSLTTSQGAFGASISVLISSLLTIPFILFIIHRQF